MTGFRGTDLPGGDYQFVVPSATYRSWVYVRGDDDATELTGASIERLSLVFTNPPPRQCGQSEKMLRFKLGRIR